MLVLFDVDKTLFMTSDPLMGRATTDAIEAVWGIPLPRDAIRSVNHPGQTATRITRELLRADGLTDDEITPLLDKWCVEASSRYLELLADADTSQWAAAEGAAEVLPQIEHRALLTGNPEPVARARMERIGLAELFPAGQGAFGCEAEERADLIAIARRRPETGRPRTRSPSATRLRTFRAPERLASRSSASARASRMPMP